MSEEVFKIVKFLINETEITFLKSLGFSRTFENRNSQVWKIDFTLNKVEEDLGE